MAEANLFQNSGKGVFTIDIYARIYEVFSKTTRKLIIAA